MAQRVETTIHYTDDIDGTQADGSETFFYDGSFWEIDLNKEHALAYVTAMAPFVEHARKIPVPEHVAKHAGSPRAGRRNRAGSAERSQQIRAWAKSQGITVSERGRIPSELTRQYDAAH